MNHFWSTCNAECEGALLVRYYIDGEKNASIVYEPGMASGTGFDDPAAPWGTKWFGHGAHSAWFNNFKIPFGSSIRVTVQSKDKQDTMICSRCSSHCREARCASGASQWAADVDVVLTSVMTH